MAYRMTAARRAALRKAQLASARARRRAGSSIKRTRTRMKARRQANKQRLYGTNWRSASTAQKINRVNRNYRRIYAAGVVGFAGATAVQLRKINADIAYKGSWTNKAGKTFNAQGGPRFLQVTPTARGARRRNRKAFKQQYGRAAYKAAKRQYKSNVKARRRAAYGPTTMQWGPRQLALPRGKGSNQRRAR